MNIKINFRARKVLGDKEGHYVTIKESIHQDDIANLNMDAPNNRAAKYVKQKLTELKETDTSTSIIDHFKTFHSMIDKSTS